MQRVADVMSEWRAARHELREALTAYDELVRRDRRAAALRARRHQADNLMSCSAARRIASGLRWGRSIGLRSCDCMRCSPRSKLRRSVE